MPRIPTILSRLNGQVYGINPKRLAEIPYFLVTNPPNNTVVIGPGLSSPKVVMSVSGEGPCEILAFSRQVVRAAVIQAQARATVFIQMQDGDGIRGLMNGSIHVDNLAGDAGGTMYRLPESLYIDELRSLIFNFTDLNNAVGVNNNINFLGSSRRYLTQIIDDDLTRVRARLDRRQYLSTPYWYTLDGGPQNVVGGGTTALFPITVGQDHHFEIHQLTRVVHEVGNFAVSGPFDIDIVDISKGESIISGPQNVHFPISGDLIFGNGNFPFKFHVPRLVQVGMKLMVTIVNRHANPQTFHLCLGGRALANRMWRS
jgi:hypothetical protein